MIYLGIDCDCLDDEGLELVRQHRTGAAVILPDDLERLRAAADKERVRRAEVEEVSALAREVMLADIQAGTFDSTENNMRWCFTVATLFVAERKKREDWK